MRAFRILNWSQMAMPAIPLIAALLVMLGGPSAQATGIYWTNQLTSTIGRANLDGTGVNGSFVASPTMPTGIAVDGTSIYWGLSQVTHAIARSNLDGSAVNGSFISGVNTPTGVAVDGTHIYWADYANDEIGRANLDGTSVNQSFISTGTNGPYGIAVSLVPEPATGLLVMGGMVGVAAMRRTKA